MHVCIIVCVQAELDPAPRPGNSAAMMVDDGIKTQGGCAVGESVVLCGLYRTMLYVGTNAVTAG